MRYRRPIIETTHTATRVVVRVGDVLVWADRPSRLTPWKIIVRQFGHSKAVDSTVTLRQAIAAMGAQLVLALLPALVDAQAKEEREREKERGKRKRWRVGVP